MLPNTHKLLSSIPILLFTAFVFAAPKVEAATYTLNPASANLTPNQTSTATLTINTESKDTVGADAHISFNPTLIEIQSVSFSGSPYPQNFSNTGTGILRLTSSFINPTDSFNGSTTLATITYKALAVGTASLSYTCSPGATNDSNIVERLTGTDLINCGSLGTSAITIAAAAVQTPAPTPEATPTPPTNTNNNTSCSLPNQPTNLRSAPYTKDSILLTWDHTTSDIGHYALTYGPSQNQLFYTVGNIGYTNNFLVSYLNPNSTYAFGVSSVNSCGQSSPIFTINKTFAGTTTSATTPTTKQVATTPITTKPNTPGFGSLTTNQKGAEPTKIATKTIVDETPGTVTASPSPSPDPYTYVQPTEQLQTRTIVLGSLILIPILLLIWFIFGRRKKEQVQELDQNELNMPPVQTLTPPPTPTSGTYSNLTDPNRIQDNPNDTQIN